MSFERARDSFSRSQDAGDSYPISSEQVEISSGYMVFLDQFMLTSKELFVELSEVSDIDKNSDNYLKLSEVLSAYGGSVVSVPSGDYRVIRDPYQSIVVLVPSDKNFSYSDSSDSSSSDNSSRWASMSDKDCVTEIANIRTDRALVGRVFVDTRCFVVFDLSLFSKDGIIQKYKTLRATGEDKKARDLLRGCGCAVRYGFNRYGDELGLFRVSNAVLALSPMLNDVGQNT